MDWNVILVALISSGATTALVTGLINWHKESRNNHSANINEILESVNTLKLATQSYLRDRLRQKYYQGIKDGYASLDDKDDFAFMFSQYEKLGANGVITKCYKEYMDLPSVL